MPVVIDASVIGPLLIPDEADDEHPEILNVFRAGSAVVPIHWHLEVANLGLTAVRRQRLAETDFIQRLADFSEFAIAVDQETSGQAGIRTVQLAITHALTVYDAAYLELALRSQAGLLTADVDLMRAAKAEKVKLL